MYKFITFDSVIQFLIRAIIVQEYFTDTILPQCRIAKITTNLFSFAWINFYFHFIIIIGN